MNPASSDVPSSAARAAVSIWPRNRPSTASPGEEDNQRGNHEISLQAPATACPDNAVEDRGIDLLAAFNDSPQRLLLRLLPTGVVPDAGNDNRCDKQPES